MARNSIHEGSTIFAGKSLHGEKSTDINIQKAESAEEETTVTSGATLTKEMSKPHTKYILIQHVGPI